MNRKLLKSAIVIFLLNTTVLFSQAPPWYYTTTNCNLTNAVMDSAFKYSLVKADSGDYIGVFYDSSGTLACGGY